jgi:hypothetical protein
VVKDGRRGDAHVIDDGVLRNYDRILELKGGNFYDESRVAKS